jgi:hypothetical protein
MIEGLKAQWSMQGIVNSKRELTSPKNAQWRGYVLKVATLGDSFEVNATAEQFASMNEGEIVKLAGHFETVAGRLKLTADTVQKAKAS